MTFKSVPVKPQSRWWYSHLQNETYYQHKLSLNYFSICEAINVNTKFSTEGRYPTFGISFCVTEIKIKTHCRHSPSIHMNILWISLFLTFSFEICMFWYFGLAFACSYRCHSIDWLQRYCQLCACFRPHLFIQNNMELKWWRHQMKTFSASPVNSPHKGQ